MNAWVGVLEVFAGLVLFGLFAVAVLCVVHDWLSDRARRDGCETDPRFEFMDVEVGPRPYDQDREPGGDADIYVFPSREEP